MSDLLKVKTGSDIDSDCNSNGASTHLMDPDSDDVLEISDKIEHLSTDSDGSENFNTANSEAPNENPVMNSSVEMGSDSDEFIELNTDYESGNTTPMLLSSSSDEFEELATDSDDEKETRNPQLPFANLFKKREQNSKCKQCNKLNHNKNADKMKKKTDRCKIQGHFFLLIGKFRKLRGVKYGFLG